MDYWPTINVLEVNRKDGRNGPYLEVKVEDTESGAVIDAGVAYYATYLFAPLEGGLASGEEMVVHIVTKESGDKTFTNLVSIKGIRKPPEGEAPAGNGGGNGKSTQPAPAPATPAAAAPATPPPADPPPASRDHPSPAPAVSKCIWTMAEPDLRAWALRSAVDLFGAKADGGKSLPALLTDCEAYILRREGPLVEAPK